MGDRANIVVKSNAGKDRVCLYTHWQGYKLPDVLRAALVRGESRLFDYQYLTRIIFCEMIKDDVEGITGFGISQHLGDGTDQVITVDIDAQTVQVNKRAPIPIPAFINSNVTWEIGT